jgi:hypothetical protein
MMRTLLHLKPGQKGTKQLLAQYGDRLVCVRYRYDAQQQKRFKTVEFIIAEREWDPPAPRFAADAIVGVRVGFAEVEVREQAKQAGGKWNRSRKVWELRYAPGVALKLEPRIVEEEVSNTRYGLALPMVVSWCLVPVPSRYCMPLRPRTCIRS